MKAVRLLLADVDGTLLTPDKSLTDQSCQAVARMRAAGVELSLTSGRPPRGLAMLTRRLGIDRPIAAFNGGMYVSADLTVVLEQLPLPLAVAREVVDHLLDAGLDVWIYRGADWFLRAPIAPHVAHEESVVQFAPTVIQDLRGVLDAAVKIVGVSDDAALVARCEGQLRERVREHASVARSQPYYLDVTHPDANKAMVVRQASRWCKVAVDEIAAIGDMPTDALMFGVAGVSIAMGNAGPEVQRAARYVTRSNAEEGFAYAIDTFVLGGLGAARSPEAALGLPTHTQACLFDLDGVLTRTAKLHAAAWKQMFDDYLRQWSARAGKPFIPFDAVGDYTRYVDGKLRIDGARTFLAARGIHLPELELAQLAARKDEILLQDLEHEPVETYGGSVRYLHAARDAGLRTAVVSSSKHCQQMLDSAGIAELFDVRIDGNVAAGEHLAGKPAPDTYLAAAHAVGVEPAHAVVFEDALSGVEAGRAGRFGYVVGVDRAGQAVELRRHGADVVVDDLAALLVNA